MEKEKLVECKIRKKNYLWETLQLAPYPDSKKTKEGHSKTKQEDWLNTKHATYFSNLNCCIVEGTLVRILVDLIYNSSNKIIFTRL